MERDKKKWNKTNKHVSCLHGQQTTFIEWKWSAYSFNSMFTKYVQRGFCALFKWPALCLHLFQLDFLKSQFIFCFGSIFMMEMSGDKGSGEPFTWKPINKTSYFSIIIQAKMYVSMRMKFVTDFVAKNGKKRKKKQFW